VGGCCDAQVELGDPFTQGELGPLDHFLTARFRLYSVLGDRLVAADARFGRGTGTHRHAAPGAGDRAACEYG
jgi:hypothetical protein